MKKVISGFVAKEARYLSRSVLLKEGVNPMISKLIIVSSSFVILGFLIWAAFMRIDEVTLAPGEIMPTDNLIRIQHIDGGTVQRIHVQEGDEVRKYQPLITLNGESVTSLLEQVEAQRRNLLAKRRNLREQIGIKKEMFEKGLSSKMSYLNLKIQLTDVDGKINENQEIIKRYQGQISRLTLNSPLDGRIHALSVKSSKEVVSSGQTILEIVPLDRKLMAEVRISPDDIGHVRPGQPVTIKFNTFDYALYGGKKGLLDEISPTTLLDEQGRPYYKGRVKFSGDTLKSQQKELKILPGMTMLGEIKTGRKTLLQYILKPVYMTAENAFRER